MTFPDRVLLPALRYDTYRGAKPDSLQSVVIAMIVIALAAYVVMNHGSDIQDLASAWNPLTLVRGGIASIDATVSGHGLAHAKDKYPAVSAMNVMILQKPNEQDNEQTLKKWLKHNTKGVVMIFAEWCPHCHKNMGPLSNLAKTHPNIPFMMVDADKVPRQTWSKDNLLEIHHFPTFAVNHKDGLKQVEPTKLAELLKELSDAQTSASARVVTVADAESAMLNTLF